MIKAIVLRVLLFFGIVAVVVLLDAPEASILANLPILAKRVPSINVSVNQGE